MQQDQDGNVLGKFLPDASNRNLQHTKPFHIEIYESATEG